MSLDDIVGDILQREGGFVDHPNDKGGPTNRGVTLKTFSDWLGREASVDELKALSEADARMIYHELYWVRPGFSLIANGKLRSIVLDMAVNHGPGNAVKILQRAVGVDADGVLGALTKEAIAKADVADLYRKCCAERVRFYGRIIANDHSQAVFAKGWMNRAAEFVEQA